MTGHWYGRMRSLLDAASPAVLTTYRAGGEAVVSPVWFRWFDGAFEVVIAEGDPKLRRLEREPQCSLLIFEAVPPFRGIEASGRAELIRGDVTATRTAIAHRYLGEDQSKRFVEARKSKPGVVLRLVPTDPKVWDLAATLPI
jgi:PPOX class probable F420-dependent enzyme